MNLQWTNHIDPNIFGLIVNKLVSYERHSTIFRARLAKTWSVVLNQAPKLQSDQKGNRINVSIPITGRYDRSPQMIDHISECAEAIIFECGNAEQSQRPDRPEEV